MVFIIAILVWFFSIMPGYLFLGALGVLPNDSNRILRVPVSFLVSFLSISFLQMVLFVSGVSCFWAGPVLILALCGMCLFLIRRRNIELPPLPPGMLGCHALFLFYLCILLMLTPTYAIAYTSDWGLYYQPGLLFAGKGRLELFSEGIRWEYLAKRTPLYVMFSAYFMEFCGKGFGVFQAVCVTANSMIFWLVVAIADRFGGRRAFVMSGLLLLCAPGMVRVCIVPEPKIVATFFVLLAWWLYTDAHVPETGSRFDMQEHGVPSALCALSAVTAVMCHPSMLFYAFPLYIHQAILAWRKRKLSALDRPLWLWSVAVSAVLVGLWTSWLVWHFGMTAALKPTLTISDPVSMGMGGYFVTRLGMIAHTIFIPEPLFGILCRGEFPALSSDFRSWISSTGDPLVRYYQQAYLGASGTLVTLLALVIWLRRSHRLPEKASLRCWLCWGLGGAAACFAVHVAIIDYKGHALNLTAPLYVLVFCAISAACSMLPKVPRTLLLVSVMMEFVYTQIVVILVSPGRQVQGLRYIAEETVEWLRGLGGIPVLIVTVFAICIYRRHLFLCSSGGGLTEGKT